VEKIRSSLAPDTPIEVWFQDEMRVGQKNKLTYRWARKGSRPRAAQDQRTQSTYLFGAVCPELGTGAALVLPFCNSEAMQLHLDEIAAKVGAGAHAIVILDHAGWHGAKQLNVPRNLSLMPLPRVRLNSTVRKTSGSSCAKIGCQTASSNPITISSTIAATPGILSSTNRGRSCQSRFAIGPTSVDQFEDWFNWIAPPWPRAKNVVATTARTFSTESAQS
jgi:DDE superfamily endonuclease